MPPLSTCCGILDFKLAYDVGLGNKADGYVTVIDHGCCVDPMVQKE
jgi:hypothetical protein